MQKRAISSRFSEKAGSYEKYALVQKKMADHLSQMVTEIMNENEVRSIVEIGCGTGRLTRVIRSHFSAAHYEAIEIASGMLEQAKNNLEQHGLICSFSQADAEEWVWEQQAKSKDLIVSGACFQWFAKPAHTLKGLGRILKSGAPLVFSTFGPDTFWELHDSFAHAHVILGEKGVRHGLEFLSARDWRELLEQAGFTDIEIIRKYERLTYPGVRDFLHAVKAVGASASMEQGSGIGRRRLLAEMIRYYEQTYKRETGIPVTYEVIYVRAVSSM
ncbi:malonyl-ACP O-methyltransferase BioC [Brevibacillus formosus]|uniref:Malonyl-[acyl-carrier protein] O-methyltransferase n=1 Tax=Brevibacillus formosus TaxID=54913 RepID=A0A837KN63_9BACL|nr:malonyl-ACP O-methyltransferase BioC [Brevibacillus formosus]KLH99038.1 malonyl-CoA O-methyltransferase [Brevibacillus formosus]PSJ98064.1 malonyl-[acyl-carrier protein] O-methyltransferase BioC [Brevibacillus formosus]GED56812.1 malonyl-[acyl-carrier protein] O-methyltransferase [Brevibacillus formosus]